MAPVYLKRNHISIDLAEVQNHRDLLTWHSAAAPQLPQTGQFLLCRPTSQDGGTGWRLQRLATTAYDALDGWMDGGSPKWNFAMVIININS